MDTEETQDYWSRNYQEVIRNMGWIKPENDLPKDGSMISIMTRDGETHKLRFKNGHWLQLDIKTPSHLKPVLWRELKEWELL